MPDKPEPSIEDYKKALGTAINALEVYASPEFYHAIMILTDRPAGGFADDESEDHGDGFYQRPMPGKLARAALSRLQTKYPDLVFIIDDESESDGLEKD